MGGSAGVSAGVLPYRLSADGRTEVFLVHPGGPFFRNRDEGSWTLPKGEVGEGEDLLAAALRELEEEVGLRPEGEPKALGSVRQKGGKVVHAWAIRLAEGTEITVHSNTFSIEWPPRSGRVQTFPEVDEGRFFELEQARVKINPAQAELLDRLARLP